NRSDAIDGTLSGTGRPSNGRGRSQEGNPGSRRIVGRMQQLIFLLLAAGIGLAVFKLRGDAAKERKAVLSRLAEERDLHGGDYSPTAELFREAGVPLVTTATGAPTFERLS